MSKVKICGVRTAANALMLADAGADMIGLNFYEPSPRYVDPATAREIVAALREAFAEARPQLIGVFVNASADEVRRIIDEAGLDFAQLSGDEPVATIRALSGRAFKAIRPADQAQALADAARFADVAPASSSAPSLLLDASHPTLYGGTGETADIAIAKAIAQSVPRLMLAGGLTPDNVAERVRLIKPWAVDVASGVEAGQPGIKAESKARAFIQALRSAGA